MTVLASTGKLVMESVLETKATILQFIHGLRGRLHVTFGFRGQPWQESNRAGMGWALVGPAAPSIRLAHFFDKLAA